MNSGFECDFFTAELSGFYWVYLSVGNFQFSRIECDDRNYFATKSMEKRNNNNKNSTQTKWIAKMALKNEIVVCFRLRSNQPRIFLEFNKTGSFWDGFQFKFAIAIRHCLVVLAVNVYMKLGSTEFYNLLLFVSWQICWGLFAQKYCFLCCSQRMLRQFM